MITPDASPSEAASLLLEQCESIGQSGDLTVLEGNVGRLLYGTELICRPLSVYPRVEMQQTDWEALPNEQRERLVASYRELGEIAHRMCIYADLPITASTPWLETDERRQLGEYATDGSYAASCLSVRHAEFGDAVAPRQALELVQAALRAFLAWDDIPLSEYARNKLRLGFSVVAAVCRPDQRVVDADQAAIT